MTEGGEPMPLLAQMLRKRLALTLAAISSSGLTAAFTLWWNAQLSGIINIISGGHPLPTGIVVLALATMFGMGATAYFKSYISGFACESMTHDIRMGYARHFASLTLAETEGLSAGQQLSKLQNEIADVSGYLNANLFQLLDDGVRFVTTILWLFFLNPKLTLTVNLPVLIIVVYVFYSSRIIGNAIERSQQAKGPMNEYADTLLTLFPIIRLYDAAQMMLYGYCENVREWEHQTVRAERTRARLMSLSGLMSSVPLMLLFLEGGNMVISGELTVGTLYIFLNLSGNVSGVMMNMPGYIATFRQFSANMKRLAPNVLLDGGNNEHSN
jgi:ABC-type multidrug transport system fused ATPase/permease subunit